MYDAAERQVRYSDHERQTARVNEAGWQIDAPTKRREVRVIVAQVLFAFAARLVSSTEQPLMTASDR